MLKNRTALGILCIALAIVICFVVTPIFNANINAKTSIVRVTKPISKGELLTKDQIAIVEVGKYNLPQNVVMKTSDAVGKYASADLMPGDYILKDKLSSLTGEENAYLYELDGTKQAISVSIKSFADGLSGKLMPNDIVSVISVDGTGTAVIPPELQYVKVLALTAGSGADTDKQKVKKDEKPELPATVTLLVSPEQAKILAELESKGNIHFSLVYRGSKENSDKFLNAEDQVITGKTSK